MKIIDAHIHYTDNEYFEAIAKAAGCENSLSYLEREFERLGIVMGVGMGNVPVSDEPGAPYDATEKARVRELMRRFGEANPPAQA